MNATTKKSLQTKSEFVASIADRSGLSKADVKKVFEALEDNIKEQVGRRGPGNFVIPGLLKSRVTFKPAAPEREGINPFTKEKQTFKARPASSVVKLVPLKGLKDMVPSP